MDAVDVKEKLIAMLRSFDTLMVATHARDNATVHARPMVLADVDDAGEIWFITAGDSDKVDESHLDQRAVVTGQAPGKFVSVSGRIDTLVDHARVRALFRTSWRAWFPNGPDDPSIVFWRLRPEIGEYWDNRSAAGVRYLFEVARAMMAGRRTGIDGGPKHHAKVPL